MIIVEGVARHSADATRSESESSCDTSASLDASEVEITLTFHQILLTVQMFDL